jgi:UDPglucose 6-dehydrogenase
VKAHDPVAMERFRRENPNLAVTCCAAPEEVADEASAIVLVTEWPEYADLPWEKLGASMRSRVVLDGRQLLDRERLERAGFKYIGLPG